MESHGSGLALGSCPCDRRSRILLQTLWNRTVQGLLSAACPAIEGRVSRFKANGIARFRAGSWELPLRSKVTYFDSNPMESHGSGFASGSCLCDRRSRLLFQALWNRTVQGLLLAAAPAIEGHVSCFKPYGIALCMVCSWQLPLRSKVTLCFKPYGVVRFRACSWQLPLRSSVASPDSNPMESYGSGFAPGSCHCDRRSRLLLQTLWNHTARGLLLAAAPAIEDHVSCFKPYGIVRVWVCSWLLPLRSKVAYLALNPMESYGSGLALGSFPCDRRPRLLLQTQWNRTVQGLISAAAPAISRSRFT